MKPSTAMSPDRRFAASAHRHDRARASLVMPAPDQRQMCALPEVLTLPHQCILRPPLSQHPGSRGNGLTMISAA
jgi:hypothetical protein